MHLFAEKYGWTIEYVMNLSMPQITSLFDGMEEVSKIQEKATKDQEQEKKQSTPVSDKDSKKPVVNDMATFLSAMGGSVKMSDRAKKKMMEIVNKKNKGIKDG